MDKINWSSVFTLQTNGLISILWEQWCLKINNKQKQSPGSLIGKGGLENIAKFKISCINSEQQLTWNPSVSCTTNAICLLLALCFVAKKVFSRLQQLRKSYIFLMFFSVWLMRLFSQTSQRRLIYIPWLKKNWQKFTGKQLCQNLFFNKTAGLRSTTL